jgi:hypothetical protein
MRCHNASYLASQRPRKFRHIFMWFHLRVSRLKHIWSEGWPLQRRDRWLIFTDWRSSSIFL